MVEPVPIRPAADTGRSGFASPGDANPDPFDRFIAIYPRRTHVYLARRQWELALLHAGSVAVLIEAAKAAASHHARAGTAPQYIPNPARWLETRMWLDSYEPPRQPPADPAAEETARLERLAKLWFTSPDNAFKAQYRANWISTSDMAELRKRGFMG